ncbi:MAG: DUF2236 domain-containing protein, partial [Chloroflexota bacterium]
MPQTPAERRRSAILSPMKPLFPPDAVIRKVDGEGVLLLGGGRALLMQLAHPSVAQGVADHSDFERDPFGRLRRTLEASFSMVFGTEEAARRTAAVLRSVHGRVTGPGYRANDPELLLWVHATLVDTALTVYRRFVGHLSPEEQEAYYRESALVAEIIGVPRDRQPADLAAFRDYMRTMIATLEVTDTARRVARAVLSPQVPWPAEPLLALVRQITIGLLPLPLR